MWCMYMYKQYVHMRTHTHMYITESLGILNPKLNPKSVNPKPQTPKLCHLPLTLNSPISN